MSAVVADAAPRGRSLWVDAWARLKRNRAAVTGAAVIAAPNDPSGTGFTPGSAVGMVPNSPRISAAAPGFGSNVSMWLGPPACQIRITDFLLPAVVAP